jgi:adenylylsulfate kinase
MRELADSCGTQWVIADFVCPLPEMRDNFAADYTVWVDTIAQGRFADTNAVFVPPNKYNFRVTTQDALQWSELVAHSILGKQ